MPRVLGSETRLLFSTCLSAHGLVRVTARGRVRKLWFVDIGGEAHLQTEAVCERASELAGRVEAPQAAGPIALDIEASLRRTPYLRCMVQRVAAVHPQRVLVLGLGGGLLPAALCSAGVSDVTVVEHSALVIGLARRFFCEPRAMVHCGSVEEFVHRIAPHAQPFDACAIDIFDSHSYRLPAFVLSASFHQALRSVLMPGARVVQNALAHSGHVEAVAPFGAPGPRRLHGELVRCCVWRRGSAPHGPLWPAVFPRQNEIGAQLRLLADVFHQAYGAATVRIPCLWAPSRVVEADIN